jgi:hypothetical protein
MARDSEGGYHLSDSMMRSKGKKPMPGKPMSSGIGAKPALGAKPAGPGMGGGAPGNSAGHTTLHDHGDGTFHTEGADGQREEHPHIGHALMHMAGAHSDGIHHHAHHDGMGGSITSHHHDGMQVHGPHEHGSSDEAADHMKGVMDGQDEAGSEQMTETPNDGDNNLHGL